MHIPIVSIVVPFLGLPFKTLSIKLVKPKKGTTMGDYRYIYIYIYMYIYICTHRYAHFYLEAWVHNVGAFIIGTGFGGFIIINDNTNDKKTTMANDQKMTIK